MPNNSMNTEELLRSEEDYPERPQMNMDSDLEDSIEIDSPGRSGATYGTKRDIQLSK